MSLYLMTFWQEGFLAVICRIIRLFGSCSYYLSMGVVCIGSGISVLQVVAVFQEVNEQEWTLLTLGRFLHIFSNLTFDLFPIFSIVE